MSRLLIALLSIVALAACTDRSEPAASAPSPTARSATTTPAPPDSPDARDAPAGVPRITFDPTTYDFGSVVDTQSYRGTFRFTNTGTGKLIIADVKASCGCTVPTLNRSELKPGESSTLDVVFNPSGKVGLQKKSISVISNAQPHNVTKLWVQGTVTPLIALGSPFLELGVLQLGQPHTHRLTIGHTDPELVIFTEANHPYVSGHIVEAGRANPPGSQWPYETDLEVTVGANAPWGVLFQATLTLTAHGRPAPDLDPVTARYTLWVNAVLFGDISAEPMLLMSNGPVGRGRPVSLSTLLTRGSGDPFAVHGVQITESSAPGLSARAVRESASSWRILLEGVTPPTGDVVQGKLAVQTDVPGEENLVLLFSMFLQ